MQTNFQREQSLHKMEGENIQNCILTHWAKHQCRDNLSECFSCFVDLWRLLNMTGQWALQGARPSDQLLQWWGHCSDPALVTAPGSLMSHRPQCWPHPVCLHCPPDGQPHWWPLTGRCFDSGPLRNCVVGGESLAPTLLTGSGSGAGSVSGKVCVVRLLRLGSIIVSLRLRLRSHSEPRPALTRAGQPTRNSLDISETMTLLEAIFF